MVSIIRTRSFYLRLASIWDAEFIFSLRSDPQISAFLSKISGGVEEQRRWLTEYKLREAAQQEFYFVILDPSCTPLGTIRVYDITPETFTWGSWMLCKQAPKFAAIESALAAYDFGFNYLGLKRCTFTVDRLNLPVCRFHDNFGARRERADQKQYYYSFDQEGFAKACRKYQKYFCTNKIL
ncbi:MAG: GNAT family N-acetyltransferase [Deltaproteobacteria bacterium]|nr:GNAT family N-acetyltransferase [Deltaproteobacteria bacterium]